MTQLRVWTTQIGRYRGPDALDVTVKSGDKTFAPTWEMVIGYKKGLISQEEYSRRYRELMRRSFRAFPERWKELLSKKEVTLLCYCRKGQFCHRLLLASYLEKQGLQPTRTTKDCYTHSK